MRFVLLQNGLTDRHTHFFSETIGWLDACRKRGHRLSVYTHKMADPVVLVETGGIAAFSFKPEHRLSGQDDKSYRDSFVQAAMSYANTIANISTGVGVDDLVVMPFANDWQVYGIALWLRSLSESNRPKVALIFHIPDLGWTPDGKSKHLQGNFSNIRFAFKHLKSVTSPDRILCFATNNGLSRELARILEIPFSTCPVPIHYFEDDRTDGRKPTPAERVHIGVIGEFRPEKGSLLVADSLELFNQTRPGKSMFVQTNYSGSGTAPGLDQLSRLDIDEIELFGGEMSQAAYNERLKNIDIFLLPYLHHRYAYRVSAIFAEAVAFGAVVVVPGQTWIAEQLDLGYGAGVVFDTSEPSEICRALIQASDRYDALRKQAQTNAGKWRQTQCTDALVEHIISRLSS